MLMKKHGQFSVLLVRTLCEPEKSSEFFNIAHTVPVSFFLNSETQWKLFPWTSRKEFPLGFSWTPELTRELKQPRRRRQQKPYKFACLTMKNNSFARFARAFFIFWHFEDVLVLSMTWNDLFCICMDDVSIWWQIQFCLPTSEALFPVNSRIVRTHFAIVITLNNWETIAETRSYIFRWRSHCGRSPVFLSSL